MNIITKICVQLSYSLLFATIEYLYTSYRSKGHGYTTFQQFCISFALVPFVFIWDKFMTDRYNSIITILLYPIVLWIVEIVGGFTMIYYYEYNPAWTYNTTDSLFMGQIKLSNYFNFLFLGIIFHYSCYYLIDS